MGYRSLNLLGFLLLALAFYGLICAVRDISAIRWTPTKTYAFQHHIIQVRSYPDGWWRKWEAMIDDWEDVLSGYNSPDDAFRAAQAHIRRAERNLQE